MQLCLQCSTSWGYSCRACYTSQTCQHESWTFCTLPSWACWACLARITNKRVNEWMLMCCRYRLLHGSLRHKQHPWDLLPDSPRHTGQFQWARFGFLSRLCNTVASLWSSEFVMSVPRRVLVACCHVAQQSMLRYRQACNASALDCLPLQILNIMSYSFQ